MWPGVHEIDDRDRNLLVRPTGRVVDVGLVKAVELEVVYAWFSCFYDASLARNAPVPG
jgi:hypothetical protein